MFRVTISLIASATTLSAATSAQPIYPPAPTTFETITFNMTKRGAPIEHWQLLDDSGGEFWRIEVVGSGEVRVLRKFRFALEYPASEQIGAINRQLHSLLKKGLNCESRQADMPRGSIVWRYPRQKEEEFNFDLGCISGPAKKAYRLMQQLTDFIAKNGKFQPEPFETETSGT